MGTYEDIQSSAQACITVLDLKTFSNGNFADIHGELYNAAEILLDLNDYIKNVDDRVIILELA